MDGMLERTATLMVAFVLVGCDGDDEGSASSARSAARNQTESAPAATASTSTAQADAPKKPSASEASSNEAKVGEPAPDFTLTDQAGNEHTLSDYRGKIVVLEWLNPECPYVQRHYEEQTMTELAESFPDDRVEWLAIDSSHFVEPSDSKKWRDAHDIGYPILQDPEGKVGRRYEARTTPHMFVIDAKGTLRYAGAIDDDPRGRKKEPTNHVDRAVGALLKGEDPPVSTTEPYGCTVKYDNS